MSRSWCSATRSRSSSGKLNGGTDSPDPWPTGRCSRQLLHRLPRSILPPDPDAGTTRDHTSLAPRTWSPPHHARVSRPRRVGRPTHACDRSARWCYASRARTLPGGYRRIHGELLVLGVKVAASTVWEILHDAGIDPGTRANLSRLDGVFLRSQAEALLAADFLETVHPHRRPGCTSLAVIKHATRPGPDPRRHRPTRPPSGSAKRSVTWRWICRTRGWPRPVPHPRPGRQVPHAVRRDPRRHRPSRSSSLAWRVPADDRDHGTVDPDLPP